MQETPESTTNVLTMPELVLARAEGDPGRVALCVDGDQTLTFGRWLDRSQRVANGLAGRAVRPGDRIALLFGDGDWIDYAIAVLAVHLSGGAVVGLSERLGPDQVRQRLRHVGAGGLLHRAGVAHPGFPGWCSTLNGIATEASRETSPAKVRPEDLAEIIYTSGTTGAAKPVAVTHANLTYGHSADHPAGGGVVGRGHGVLTPVPLGTNAGHSAIMVALTGGTTVHVLTRPTAPSVAEAIERLAVEMVILPAPLATRFAVSGALEGRDLCSLKALMLGSAPVPGATAHYLRTLAPDAAVSIGYGSTEAAPAFTQLSADAWAEHPGSLGRPRPGVDLEIRDPDGEQERPGGVGEIWLRSPAPQRGYFGTPDDGTFQDGWTRMGDLGSVDEEGFLFFFDRAADALVRDGTRISSSHIEDALHWHPDIADAAVFQLPDDPDGRVTAAIEFTRPVPDADLTAFLAERLAEHEMPDLFVPVDSFPRGALGKVVKRRLAETAGL